jgi:hypothetical protein
VAGSGSGGRGGGPGIYGSRKTERSLAVDVRDRLGEWLHDEAFAAAFGTRGRPGWSPSRLTLVTVLQRAENLTDRMAAEQARARLDWKYLLGLALDDPGFDHTVLAGFRAKAADAGLEDELAVTYAKDGYALLEAVYDKASPAWLAELPAVETLRQVLVQNYTRVVHADGTEVVKRRERQPEGDGLPPGRYRIASPYDTDARWGAKRDTFWLGYKLHVTETCDDVPPCGCGIPGDGAGARSGHAAPEFPNLIIHVETTDATVTDNAMTGTVDDALADKGLAPAGHYLDSGYLSAAIVASFAAGDCRPCPARDLCTKGKRRQVSVPPRDLAQAQADSRAAEKTRSFQAGRRARRARRPAGLAR